MDYEQQVPENPKRQTPIYLFFFVLVSLIILIGVVAFFVVRFENTPPAQFPVEAPVTIEKGLSLTGISSSLKMQGVIRSGSLFRAIVLISGATEELRAGVYEFPNQLSTIEVIHALVTGLYSNKTVRVTIPEGSSAKTIGDIVVPILSQINAREFTDAAVTYEGYLFPETYYVPPAYTSTELISLMRVTFDEQTASLQKDILKSGRSLHDIVVLASLLEKEGKSEESMRLIAGILYKRMKLGMPLQVDAPFAYILGKESSELTLDDLKIVSPYNTYTNKGLPPDAIGNPGLTALRAALNPTESPYLYYLSDSAGNFHYAKTFEEHKRNKERYLR